MAILAACPDCGRKGNVPDEFAGRKVKCPGCSKPFTIAPAPESPAACASEPAGAAPPAPAIAEANANGAASAPTEPGSNGATAAQATPTAKPATPDAGFVVAECPECGFSGRVPGQYRGRKVKCRQCGEMFKAGEPAAKATPGIADDADDTQTEAAASTTLADDIGLAPIEEEKPAEEDVAELELVEEVEEAPRKPVKTGGSQAGTQKVTPTGGSHVGTQNVKPAEKEEPAAPNPFASLDAPEPKKRPRRDADDDTPRPRPVRKPKPAFEDDEEEKKKKTAALATIIAAAGIGLILVIGGALFLVLGGGGKDKPQVARNTDTGAGPAVNPPPSKAKAPPPTQAARPPSTERRPVMPRDPDPLPKADPDPEPKKDPDPPEAKEGEWVDASQGSTRLGDVRIKVAGVWVDDVKIMMRGENVAKTGDILVVQLEVGNRSEAKQVLFHGWGAARPKPGEPSAQLTDSAGRLYRRQQLEEIEGASEGTLLAPGKHATDRIIFELPDAKVEFLRLELPAENFGGKGYVRFKVPNSMVVAKATKEPEKADPKADKKLADLRTKLKSKQGPLRVEAAREIGLLRSSGTPAVPDLLVALRDRNDNVRVAAAEALSLIAPRGKEGVVKALMAALKDEFWMVRAKACLALGVLGPEAKEALPLLHELSKSKDEEVPDNARHAIRQIDPQGKFEPKPKIDPKKKN